MRGRLIAACAHAHSAAVACVATQTRKLFFPLALAGGSTSSYASVTIAELATLVCVVGKDIKVAFQMALARYSGSLEYERHR